MIDTRYEVIEDTIKRHRKRTIERCDCGWAKLGQDHADHLALAVDAAIDLWGMTTADRDELHTMVMGVLDLVEGK